jgi:hypothetical protein
MQKTPSRVWTIHVDQRRPRMPPLRDDQSELYPPSERAKRFMRPQQAAQMPASCGVRPWYL